MVPIPALRYSHGSIRSLLVLLLWFSLVKNVFCNLVASDAGLSTRQVQNLVPSRRGLPLVARNAPPLSHLSPKDAVVLDYIHPSPGSSKATVTFAAHPGRPIVLLEDMDHLFHSVACDVEHGSELQILHIVFFSEGAYSDALNVWNAFHDNMLYVITSHPTCNPSDERAAWSILSIISDRSKLTLHLVVEPLALSHVGQSYNVRFDQSNIIGGSGPWQSRDLQRRWSDVVTFNNHTSLSGQHFSSANFPGAANDLLAQIGNSNLEFVCVNCDLSYNFNVGMEFDVQDKTVTASSINITVEEFAQSAVVQISMNQTLDLDKSIDLFTLPLTPASVPLLFTVGPSIGLSLNLGFAMNSSINFTVGAFTSIRKGATASVNFLDENNGASTQNWGGNGQKNIFRLNGGTFDMDATVSLSPFVELGATLFASTNGIKARISQQVPRLYVNASMVSSVNRACNPLGDNDFESFGTAFAVNAGVGLTTIASLDLVGVLADIPAFSHNWEKTLYTVDYPLLKQNCSIIADDKAGTKNSLSNLMPAAAGTLVPAASAVPTFDLTKIESYYSANGHLPTNVNYAQMVKATTVPDNIKKAVQAAAKNGGLERGFGVGGRCGTIVISFLVIFFVFL